MTALYARVTLLLGCSGAGRSPRMVQLPGGTVTLLFADVEGSTGLLLRLGDRYPAVLEEQREILRAAVASQGGRVVDTQGDELFAAFGRAADAVAAAVAAQRALTEHPWPEGSAVRVRMGLHTGEPSPTPTGYAGLDVHRAARLCDAGHGGQVLLSQTTADLVGHTLPNGLSLRNLGHRRLRDLPGPERVYQLVVPGLQVDFPPLRALEGATNLPAPRRPLIGREREAAAARELLLREEVALVTLTGPGGTGKTHLGIQVAGELRDAFPDGVYFVPLAPIGDPGLVAPATARALGIRETAGRSLHDSLKEALRPRRQLLLLDNFEHLLDAAPLVAELLQACPKLKVLATSREVLHLSEEHDLPVPPLDLPDPRARPSIDELSRSAAVRLFVERARDVKPDFGVTDDNAATVAEICRRLDGLPLAIELAAARIRLLAPAAMLRRLEHRLPLLVGGPRDLPARQQTLHATIAWSHDLLNPAEQVLLRRLAVFIGGCTLEAAETVCAFGAGDGQEALASPICDLPSPDVLDGLASLVDKNLLRQREAATGEPRFSMLETIRDFALEQLEASGDAEAVRCRHATFFLELAEQADPELLGPEQVRWLKRLEVEHGNFGAALAWAREAASGEPSPMPGAVPAAEVGLRLAGALHWFWWLGGHLSEGRGWLKDLLMPPDAPAERPASGRSAVRARALYAAGGLAMVQGDYDAARAWLEESVETYRALGDAKWIGRSLTYLGLVLSFQGDGAAEATFERSVALLRAVGDTWGLALAGAQVASFTRQRGDLSGAAALIEEYVGLARATGDRYLLGSSLPKWGHVALELADYDRAAALYREALGLFRELRDGWWTARCLHYLGLVAGARGEYRRAVRLMASAETLLESVGARLIPREQADHERALAAARAELGEAFPAAWAEGRALSTEQAIRYALDESGSEGG